MKTIKIYLAHSLTQAPPEFLRRMRAVRQAIRAIAAVEVLDFAWEKGPEFNERVNVYEYDMRCVAEADLVIAVLDFISSGTAMEIQTRCSMQGRALACFFQHGTKVSKIIGDCIKHHRRDLENSQLSKIRQRALGLPDPFSYLNDCEITQYALDWVQRNSDVPVPV